MSKLDWEKDIDPAMAEAARKYVNDPAFFERVHKPMKCMYVDMNAIFDYPLTALMLMIQNQDQWEYVHSRWDDYVKYKGEDITTVFPELGIDRATLYAYLRDPANTEAIALNGLLTNHSHIIPAQLAFFKMTNSNLPLAKDEPMVIHFTSEYFPIPEAVAKSIRGSLVPFIGDLSCTFKHGSIANDSRTRLGGVDTFILSDITAFVQPDTVSYTMLYKERAFTGSCIISDYRLDEDSPYLIPELEEQITNTERLLCTMTYFYFLDRVPLFLVKDSEVTNGKEG